MGVLYGDSSRGQIEMTLTLILNELGGQGCSVRITKRRDGSVVVAFLSTKNYGYPTMEIRELEMIIDKAQQLQKQV